MRRRLLILLLFGLALAGGAAVTWQAMGRAKLVEEDLITARALLARAGGFESGELKQRLRLVQQAEQHSRSAQHRLDQWPLRQLVALPWSPGTSGWPRRWPPRRPGRSGRPVGW
jgi:hypothetical protein